MEGHNLQCTAYKLMLKVSSNPKLVFSQEVVSAAQRIN